MTIPNSAPRRGRGQPTLYTPEFCERARKLCEEGATNADLAEAFGVARRSVKARRTRPRSSMRLWFCKRKWLQSTRRI
jgi:hypothetical protein